MKNKEIRYNHAFDVAFSLENNSPDGDVTERELLLALLKRIHDLYESGELMEACGAPFDTHEFEVVDD